MCTSVAYLYVDVHYPSCSRCISVQPSNLSYIWCVYTKSICNDVLYTRIDLYVCAWVEVCVCISIGHDFFMLTCAHIVLYKQELQWMCVAVVHWRLSERDILSLCHFKKQSVWESPVWHKNTPHSLQNHDVCVRFLCCEQQAQRLLFLSSSDGSLSTFSGKCCRGRARMTPQAGPAGRRVVYSPISTFANCSQNFLMVLKRWVKSGNSCTGWMHL